MSAVVCVTLRSHAPRRAGEPPLVPFHWTGAALLRSAAAVSMTAWLSSTLTTAISSHMLLDVDDDAPRPVVPAVDERQASASERSAAARERAEQERAQRERLASSLATIVDNNVFCPSCRMQADTPTSLADTLPAPTSLPLRLLATMQSDKAIDSLASVEDTQLERTGIYGVDDELRPGVSIAAIGAGAVMLRGPNGLQRLEFGAPEAAATKPPKRETKTKAKTKGSSAALDGARAAISCEQHACTVEREFVDKLLANPAQLTRQARFVPSVRDGQARGFRVYRVRRGSLPQLLGLKNGDTLLSINGTALDSMDAAIRLYTRLRRASHVSAMVERKGEVFELQLDIR